MVGVAGFEPATPTSRTWCATRLRYTPTDVAAYTSGTPALQAGDLSMSMIFSENRKAIHGSSPRTGFYGIMLHVPVRTH